MICTGDEMGLKLEGLYIKQIHSLSSSGLDAILTLYVLAYQPGLVARQRR
jgi:hypothetical protein